MTPVFTGYLLHQVTAGVLSGLVFFVANFFQPFDDLAVERFLNGDVRHCSGWRGAVPMLLTRRAPDHVARSNFDFWSTFALHPTAPGGDDEGLPKRVEVPR